MRLLHASAFDNSLVAETKVWFLISNQSSHPKRSLLDSDAVHTNVTKHLKLIVLFGKCKTSSVIFLKWYQIFLNDCSLALHIWRQRKEIHPCIFFFVFCFFSPCSNWAHVCLGWERERVLQSLCTLQTDKGIGHININMQRYCQNIILHGLWFRIGWLESDRNRKKLCVFRPSQCSFPAELW